MKDKIISFVAWIFVWAIAVWAYHFILAWNNAQNFWPMWEWNPPSFNASNMSDEQLERMATRVGMTKDELKKEIESGKDIRTIMQEKWVGFGWRWTRTWSWKTE